MVSTIGVEEHARTPELPYAPADLDGDSRDDSATMLNKGEIGAVISLVRSDRECSPLWTAPCSRNHGRCSREVTAGAGSAPLRCVRDDVADPRRCEPELFRLSTLNEIGSFADAMGIALGSSWRLQQ
jgi:hypothetical protein